jgi:hypothetical protein
MLRLGCACLALARNLPAAVTARLQNITADRGNLRRFALVCCALAQAASHTSTRSNLNAGFACFGDEQTTVQRARQTCSLRIACHIHHRLTAGHSLYVGRTSLCSRPPGRNVMRHTSAAYTDRQGTPNRQRSEAIRQARHIHTSMHTHLNHAAHLAFCMPANRRAARLIRRAFQTIGLSFCGPRHLLPLTPAVLQRLSSSSCAPRDSARASTACADAHSSVTQNDAAGRL